MAVILTVNVMHFYLHRLPIGDALIADRAQLPVFAEGYELVHYE